MKCAAESPSLVKLYERLHDQGFEILGVSVDDERPEFEQAAKDRKLNWTQIFDGRGMKSELAQLFNLQFTPGSVVLDRDGRLVGKNLPEKDLVELIERTVAKK